MPTFYSASIRQNICQVLLDDVDLLVSAKVTELPQTPSPLLWIPVWFHRRTLKQRRILNIIKRSRE